MQVIYYTSFPTSVARIYVAATAKGIWKISLTHKNEKEFLEELRSRLPAPASATADRPAGKSAEKGIVKNDAYFKSIKKDILKYLSGKPVNFTYQIDMKGTDFQRKVWRALRGIPYGRILTYKQVAERIGLPKASRAVGGACGANELPIIIPCHRVIATGGSLGGFGGGLKLKRHLLRLERVKLKRDMTTH
ncbi:MAG: methylated-DNA--[protein]-cysteine S-methyltransferase [Deltaproteobacteria bacterium]|nr:methylated-DNA--[protein]-cysteine S-methyltransferase [Deltaproteobacteria bacterium]